MFLCFTIRNTAYYYPLVSILAFLLCIRNWRFKLAGACFPMALLIPFMFYTKEAAFKLTGTKQYSLFTGWQLANNALYIYSESKIDSSLFRTKEARQINQIAMAYFKHIKPDLFQEYLNSYVGNFFVRQPEAPLKQYLLLHYGPAFGFKSIVNWGKASADFEVFGGSIIRSHPVNYLKYFVVPNIGNYLLPPLSHLELYNYGSQNIDSIAMRWFHYAKPKITCASSRLQGYILYVYPILFLFFNGYLLLNVGLFFGRGRWRYISKSEMHISLVMSVFLVVNFAFSVVSTENILRYQCMPAAVLLATGLIFSDQLQRAVNYRESNDVREFPINYDSHKRHSADKPKFSNL